MNNSLDFPIFRKNRPDERRLLFIISCIFLLAVYILNKSKIDLPNHYPYIAGLFIILSFWVVHAFLIWRKEKGDELIFPLCAFLITIGWLTVLRLRPDLAYKQMAWIFIGEAVMIAWLMLVKDYRVLEDYKYIFLVGAILIQASVAIFGKEVNGAKLWFDFKYFSFQPVEFVKILLTFFLASYLKQNRGILEKPLDKQNLWQVFKYLIPLFVLWGVAESVLIVQKDLGMALLLFGVFMGLFYVSTKKTGLTIAGAVMFAGGAYLLYLIFPHVQVRINTWLNPWANSQGAGYQIVQAMYALANGGLTGAGLGMGSPMYIPAVHTDYIFVAIAEELGLWGAFVVLGAYLALIQRMFKTSVSSTDEFSAYLSLGLSLLFATQVFVIIAGAVKLIPLTGITLPFISYGGSSLVSNFILVGLFLQISGNTGNKG